MNCLFIMKLWFVLNGCVLMEMIETPLTRMLYAKEIEHSVLVHKKPAFSCEEVSRERNIAAEDILKCILITDKAMNHSLFCIPGNAALDLKLARKFLCSSRLSFATREEVELVTGCRIGTLNPFFHNLNITVIFDRSIVSKGIVDVSSGSPNAGVQLQAQILLLLANPKLGDVIARIEKGKVDA